MRLVPHGSVSARGGPNNAVSCQLLSSRDDCNARALHSSMLLLHDVSAPAATTDRPSEKAQKYVMLPV